MPTIYLTDEEHAAVTAAMRRAIADDRYPLSPRLDPLKSALAKLECGADLAACDSDDADRYDEKSGIERHEEPIAAQHTRPTPLALVPPILAHGRPRPRAR